MTGAGGPREPAPAADLSVTPDGFVVPGTGPETRSWWRRLRGSRLFVCFMLFLVGPFALGLLWRGRRFGLRWKIALTAATLLYTAAAVFETVVHFPRFVEWGRQIGERLRSG